MNFLRYLISKEGKYVNSKKMETKVKWLRPETAIEMRSFLRLTGYYKSFVKRFSQIATPMTRLTQKVRQV